MLEFILGLAFGFAFGWLVPVPSWFTKLTEKIEARLNKE